MIISKNIEDLPSVKVIGKVVNVLWYLGWLAMILLVIIIGFLYATDKQAKFINLPVSVSYEETPDEIPLDLLNRYNEKPVVGFKYIKIDNSKEGGFDYSLLIPLFMIGGYMWTLHQFRRFVKTILRGEPFDRENPRRIRHIGFVVMIAGPIVGAIQYLHTLKYIYDLDFPGAKVEIEPDIYPAAIFLGLILFVIGHVYDLAVKLKEDQELTI